MVFLKILLGLGVLVLVAHFIGMLLSSGRMAHNNSLMNFAFSQQLGILGLVCIYAAVLTHMKTVFICSIPVLVYVAIQFRKLPKGSKWGISRKDLYLILIFFVLAALLAFVLVRGHEIQGMKVPVKDQASYAMIVKGLNIYPVENTSPYLYGMDPGMKPCPYHYFEIWLAAAVSFMLGYNAVLSLTGVASAFILFNLFCLVYSIFRQDSMTSATKFAAGFCCLLFPVQRGFMHYFANDEYYWDSIFYDGNFKFIFLLPFFISSLCLLWSRSDKLAICMLLVLPLVNTVLLPVVFLALMLYVMLLLIFRMSFPFHLLKIGFILVVTAYIVLMAVYLFGISSDNGASIVTSLGGIANTILSNGSKWGLINCLLLLACIILAWRIKDTLFTSSFFLILSLVGSGLILRAVFDTNQNSFQIFSSVAFLSVYGLTLLLMRGLIYNFPGKPVAVFGGYIIMSLWMWAENYPQVKHVFSPKISAYSQEYLDTVSTLQFTNPIGIRFVNGASRSNLMKNPTYAGISDYFPLTQTIHSTVVMNVDQLFPSPEDSSHHAESLRREFRQGSVFIRTTDYDPGSSDSAELSSKILQYVNRYKPQFCIVEKGSVIPDYIKSKVTKVIVDRFSREMFCLMDPAVYAE
jgi:hypothetical protein